MFLWGHGLLDRRLFTRLQKKDVFRPFRATLTLALSQRERARVRVALFWRERGFIAFRNFPRAEALG